MRIDSFAQYLAEVCSYSQIAAFVEMLSREPRPAAIDSATLDRAAEHEHDVGVAVVGAAIAVLARGAPELRHADDHCVFAKIAQIGPERSDGLRELASEVGDLALHAAFVHVVVPSADVGESDFHAQVGFDQLRYLAQTVTKTSAGYSAPATGVYFSGSADFNILTA